MDARILDVILLGPMQILVGTYIENNIFLKWFMIITGLLNILYNGHNFLYFQYDTKILPILYNFVDIDHGKIQLHRLYNILIMYPIFLYIYLTISLPLWLKYIFLFDIIIGFIFNLFNFLKLL